MRICAFRHGGIVPPLYGALIRSYELLVNLTKKGHEVSLYSYGEASRNHSYHGIRCSEFRRPRAFLNRLGKVLYGVEGEWGFTLLSSGTPRLAALARREIKACDVVYVEHIWSSIFPLIYSRIYGKRSVLDDHNVETILANRARQEAKGFLQRVLSSLWLLYVFFLEKMSCSLVDIVVVTSPTDRDILHRTLGVHKRKIEVIPNGVDLDEFHPSCEDGLRVRACLAIDRNAPVIMFVGMLDYPPNLYSLRWIVEELAPQIMQRKPDARFLIVGRNPPKELIGKGNNIIFTGEVESAAPYINASDVCIAPITVGSGTRMKILCYLSCEKPVVSTRLGVEGLDPSIVANISVGHLNELPDLILDQLMNPRGRPETQVRKAICGYDWKTLSSKLENVLKALWRNDADR